MLFRDRHVSQLFFATLLGLIHFIFKSCEKMFLGPTSGQKSWIYISVLNRCSIIITSDQTNTKLSKNLSLNDLKPF